MDCRRQLLSNIIVATLIVIEEMEKKGRRLDLDSGLEMFMQRMEEKREERRAQPDYESKISSISATSLPRILGSQCDH